MNSSLDLAKLVKAGEGENLELKASFNTGVIETLVAFANTRGGKVVIGVSEKQELKGVCINAESVQNWLNEVKCKTTPSLVPEAMVAAIGDNTFVVLSVQEYPIKPVATRGKYFKRIANSNHLMNSDEIASEVLKTINSSWDFYPDSMHGIEDIDLAKVERFIKHIEQNTHRQIAFSPLDFLTRFEMIRKGKLSVGGYLLFAKEHCPISDVQIGRFKSPTAIIDSISLNTDLISQVDEILFFIRKHMMVEYIITGMPQRIERYDYPEDAVREIVINMIVHRDYRDTGHSIIKIFDDRIEFFNPGKLYGGLTVADLLSGNYTSQVRNKLIANAFKEIGLVERYGSGISRIINICKDYGLRMPVFEEFFQGFRVTLFKEKSAIGEKVGENLTENQESILNQIQLNKYISARELSLKIGISQRKIEENLSKLKERKILRRVGSPKGGYWDVIK